MGDIVSGPFSEGESGPLWTEEDIQRLERDSATFHAENPSFENTLLVIDGAGNASVITLER